MFGVRIVCGIKIAPSKYEARTLQTIAINSTRSLAQRVDYNNRYILQGSTLAEPVEELHVARLPNVLQQSQTDNSLHKPNM